MGKKTNFVGHVVEAVVTTASASRSVLKDAWHSHRLAPERAKRPPLECQYCCEHKREYNFIAKGAIPYNCQLHLSNAKRVCKSCMDAALRAQLDSKSLIEVGCPECGVPWDPEDVKMLVSLRTQKRFKELDKLAREQVLIPAELPDNGTVDLLLETAARFCPWCRWPFVNIGGCDSMLCSKCGKFFDVKYALVLEDGSGRRAAEIAGHENLDNLRARDYPGRWNGIVRMV